MADKVFHFPGNRHVRPAGFAPAYGIPRNPEINMFVITEPDVDFTFRFTVFGFNHAVTFLQCFFRKQGSGTFRNRFQSLAYEIVCFFYQLCVFDGVSSSASPATSARMFLKYSPSSSKRTFSAAMAYETLPLMDISNVTSRFSNE